MTTGRLARLRRRALVLCVDEECRAVLQTWLRDAGLAVDIVGNGAAVAAGLRDGDVTALFIDRFPPTWPDLETIATLKRQGAGLRVIVVGDPEAEHFRLAAVVGVDAALPRPLRRAMVLEALGLDDGHDGWCVNEHGDYTALRKGRQCEMVDARRRA